MARRAERALALAPALLVLGLLFGGGLLAALRASLGLAPLALGAGSMPGAASLAAYRALVARPDAHRALAATAWVAIASTACAVSAGTALGLALRVPGAAAPRRSRSPSWDHYGLLGRFRARARTAAAMAARGAPYLVLAVPYALAALVLALVLAPGGLPARLAYHAGWIASPRDVPPLTHDPRFLGVIAAYAWKGMAFVAVLVLASLSGRQGHEAAARTLGATRVGAIRRTTLPRAAPVVVLAAGLLFAFTAGGFEVPLLLGPRHPSPLPVMAWRAFHDPDLATRPQAMALALGTAALAAVGLVVAAAAVWALGALARVRRRAFARGTLAQPVRAAREGALRPAGNDEVAAGPWPQPPGRLEAPAASRARAPAPSLGRRRAGWSAMARMAPSGRCLASAGAGMLAVLPFVPIAIWSVAQRWPFPELLPPAYSTRAWRYALDPGAGVLAASATSAAVASATTLAAFAVGVPASLGLAGLSGRWRRPLHAAFLAPALVPPIAYGLGLQAVLARAGLADRFGGVAAAHLVPVLPYVILPLSIAWRRRDRAAEEAARTLGAGRLRALWHVVLPSSRATLAAVAALAFLVSLDQYLLTLLAGGGRVRTLGLVTQAFLAAGDRPMAATLAIVQLAPAAGLLWLAARTARRGP